MGRTGRSSRPQEYPALGQLRRYTTECLIRRCRTGRRWLFVWSAFVFPALKKRNIFKPAASAGNEHKTQKSTHVDGHDLKINVVEQLIVIFHRHAGREEDHQLLLAVLLQEGEEQEEALL